MDDHATVITFLLQLEKLKSTVLSKDNSQRMKKKKDQAWKDIQQHLADSGTTIELPQLRKKWNNCQTRLKLKIRQRTQTEGRKSANLEDVDKITLRIVGETNPIYTMVPGAYPPAPVSPTADKTTPSSTEQPSTSSAGSSSSTTLPVELAQTYPTQILPPFIPPIDCTIRSRKIRHAGSSTAEDDRQEILEHEACMQYYSVATAYYRMKFAKLYRLEHPHKSIIDDLTTLTSDSEISDEHDK